MFTKQQVLIQRHSPVSHSAVRCTYLRRHVSHCNVLSNAHRFDYASLKGLPLSNAERHNIITSNTSKKR